MIPGNRRNIVIILAAALAVGLLVAVLLSSNSHQGVLTKTSMPASSATPAAETLGAGMVPRPVDSGLALDNATKDLLSAGDANDSRRILAKLRAYLLSLPKSVAARLIAQFLNQKRDAGTKLDFTVGKNGMLTGAPTMRIFLLDLLAQIDPQAAGQYAMQILESPSSPDEWAICLRNYARYDATAAGQAYLQSKIQEMIANAAWRQDPSIGYLEAFDTIVYSHDTALTPNLAGLVSDPNNKAVAHAAYLALDRLTIQDPATVLSQLEAQPALMQGHELTRANYFARADISDPTQQSLVESYLLDPNRSQQELNTFAALFPNENFMLSNNLLTQDQTPTGAQIIQKDQAALGVVQTWIADPRFQPVLPQLQTMQKRLQVFVNEAAAQGAR